MNILLLNANNPYQASGIVALNLFKEFKKKGHHVRLLTNNYDPNYDDGIISMETPFTSFWRKSKFYNKLFYLKKKYKLLRETHFNNKYDFFEFKEQKFYYRTSLFLRKAGMKPDVIIVLFAKKYLNTKNIYELYIKSNAQIYWLMYDMAPFTGGCHYAWDCKGYENSCGKCPGLYSADPFDLTFKNILYKRHYLDNTNVQIIAASEWQYRQAKRSSLFRDKSIHKILLSADPAIYKPVDKLKERIKMGLSPNKKIIFFGSVELTSVRKGMSYLLDSLKILKQNIKNTALENEILLVIAGGNIDGIKVELPFDYHYLGLVDNTYGIASAYQIADVFICPSIEDSGPTMINQSIMSGTPVVSFEMGVALDLVITGKTGYLAKIKDSNSLAQGLYDILTLTEENYKELSDNCRNLGLKNCSPDIQIEVLEKLFSTDAVQCVSSI